MLTGPPPKFHGTRDILRPRTVVAMHRSTRPDAAPRIARHPVRLLTEVHTCPTLALDRVDPVLPRRNRGDRHLDAKHRIGVLGPDVVPASIPHGGERWLEVVHPTRCDAEGLVML